MMIVSDSGVALTPELLQSKRIRRCCNGTCGRGGPSCHLPFSRSHPRVTANTYTYTCCDRSVRHKQARRRAGAGATFTLRTPYTLGLTH